MTGQSVCIDAHAKAKAVLMANNNMPSIARGEASDAGHSVSPAANRKPNRYRVG